MFIPTGVIVFIILCLLICTETGRTILGFCAAMTGIAMLLIVLTVLF